MDTTTHHAIVFDGDREAGLREAGLYVQRAWGIAVSQNSDVFTATYEQMSIEDARDITMRASLSPIGSLQVFILGCDKLTPYAQNALLKLLEEPNKHTRFVLVVPDMSILIPTIRSRLLYVGHVVGAVEEREFAMRLVRATPRERVKLFEPLHKGVKENEKLASRNRVRRVVEAIEVVLHEQGVVAHARALREVVFVRTYIQDPSSSLKMLLEHLAVTM